MAEQRTSQEQWEGELFRLLVENVQDYAIFVVDDQRRVRSWSHGAERLLGYTESEIVGQSADRFFTPQDVANGVPQQEIAQTLATGRGEDDRWHMRKDGSRFWSSGVMTPLRDESGSLRGFAKIMRDMTRQVRADHHRNVRMEVTQVLAEATTVEAAVSGVLRAVGESLNWDVGLLWTHDRQSDVLRCLETWHREAVGLRGFDAISRQSTFRRGDGLPGHVWATGAAAWLHDMDDRRIFRRAFDAAREGLHDAFAFPIRLGSEFIGVIEFFSRSVHEPDPDLSELMAVIGLQISQFLERRRAEQALRESEQRFARFMQHLPGLAWIKDLHGRYVYANEAAEKAFRMAKADLYGRTDAELFPPEIAEQFQANDEKAIASVSGVQVIETLKHPDDVVHHSLVSKFPILGPAGRPAWVGGMAIDVTDRLRAEEQVRFQAHLLDSVGQAAVVTDPEGRIIYWNRFAETLYGWSGQDALGRQIVDLVVPSSAAAEAEQILSGLKSGQGWSGEMRLRRRDGSEFIAFVTDTPIFDDAGRMSAVIGISADITERKQMEQALRFLADASATLALLVDYQSTLQTVARLAVPYFADWCGVDIVEPDGRLRRLAMAHVDPNQSELARQLDERYPRDPGSAHGSYRVLRTGESEIVEEFSERLLGQLAVDEEHLGILRDLQLKSAMWVPLQARGRTLGVLTFVTSGSGRRYTQADLGFAEELARRAAVAIENAQLYADLRDADRLKDEFLAMLAHELRNPLAPISNALEIMRRPLADPQLHEQARQMAERQVRHMAVLLDDLLDVSRISRGRIQLRKEPVDLVELSRRTVEVVRPFVVSRRHELTVEFSTEKLMVEGDPHRLEQIVTNLLNNAAKYTEPGGKIWFSVFREDGSAVLLVRDTGIGITADVLPHVFDLFVQADRRLDRSQGGVGIGLTLVKKLVELHGGSVEARSAGAGQGSEFTVRIGALSQADPAPAAATGEGGKARPKLPRWRILVVDDNQDAASSLAMLLKLKGQEVRTCNDGQAALDLVEDFRPDLVLLDIGMPGMDGYEVARRLRQQPSARRLLLVALTGWGQEEDRRRSKEAGFDHHVVKPVHPGALEKLLVELASC